MSDNISVIDFKGQNNNNIEAEVTVLFTPSQKFATTKRVPPESAKCLADKLNEGNSELFLLKKCHFFSFFYLPDTPLIT